MGFWSELFTRPAFTWSIRKHLLILVLVAVLPAMGLMLLTGMEMRDHAVRDAQNHALKLVQEMAGQQERVINDARILLMTPVPGLRGPVPVRPGPGRPPGPAPGPESGLRHPGRGFGCGADPGLGHPRGAL